jgi:hypothetical protein
VTQNPLWTPAVAAIVMRMNYVPQKGWECQVQVRRDGQTWDQATSTLYEMLSTEELLDVATSLLTADLGL